MEYPVKKFIALILGIVTLSAQTARSEERFPPVPEWQPGFAISVDQVLERMRYYTNNSKDIILFKNGTAVILPDGLKDDEAKAYAQKVLSLIFNYHPDMHPVSMKDGNILIQYNHPAFNVVITEFADKHIDQIRKHHLDALATHEVLITPLGNNKFDDFGMKALYGRTFMFMDAQNPVIVKLHRH